MLSYMLNQRKVRSGVCALGCVCARACVDRVYTICILFWGLFWMGVSPCSKLHLFISFLLIFGIFYSCVYCVYYVYFSSNQNRIFQEKNNKIKNLFQRLNGPGVFEVYIRTWYTQPPKASFFVLFGQGAFSYDPTHKPLV